MNDLLHHERSMPMNDLLSNRATQWRVQAHNADRAAEEATAAGDDLNRQLPGMGNHKHREAKKLAREADRHEARAEHAEHGALLHSVHEHDWTMKNSGLIGRASKESRIVHDDYDPNGDDGDDGE